MAFRGRQSQRKKGMGFCDALREVSRKIWEAEKTHPFVSGMGDGSLPAEKFRFYLEQDYLFLIEYAKVFALAVPKAGGLEDMAYFAQLCSDTLNGEMELHRSYCAEFGIAPAELEAARPSRPTVRYTGHLLRAADAGPIARTVPAVLPRSVRVRCRSGGLSWVSTPKMLAETAGRSAGVLLVNASARPWSRKAELMKVSESMPTVWSILAWVSRMTFPVIGCASSPLSTCSCRSVKPWLRLPPAREWLRITR